MNEYYVKVNFEKGMIQTNLKKLVQNDYNSTKLNFTFDKEGRVLFKLLRPDNSQYVDEIVDNTLIFSPGILSEVGDYEYEISLYTEDGRLTDYAIKSFEVRDELVNTDEIVEVDDRVPILDNLISEANQINNIDIDIEDSVITLKRKDGTIKVKNVKGDTYEITEEDYQEIETNVKSDIQPILENIENISKQAEVIARGRATGYVFNTIADLDNWLLDEENVSKLTLGDNFYIVATNVPDYWWDGTQKRVLETEKPDLTQYAKKEQFVDLTQDDYDDLQTKNANTYYYIYEQEE